MILPIGAIVLPKGENSRMRTTWERYAKMEDVVLLTQYKNSNTKNGV